MTTFIKGYGRRIAAIRTATGLGKQAFARKVLSPNASARNISRLENEEVLPRSSTLQKLAAFGGVTPEWLSQGICALKPTDLVGAAGVGNRIAEARKQAGMSALSLAKTAGLGETAQNVRRIEVGTHRPTLGTVTKIASALRVPVTQLAFGA